MAVVAILVAAAVDHEITSQRIPYIAPATIDRPNSSNPAVAEAEQLREGYLTRVWIYSLALMGVVAALVARGLRSQPRDRRRELFTDLGVAGVCALGVSTVIALNAPELLDNDVSRQYPIWLPPISMLLVAGAGSVVTLLSAGPARSPSRPAPSVWADEPVPGQPRIFARAGRIAAGLAALTILLQVIGAATVNEHSCADRTDGVAGVALIASLVSLLLVGSFGVVALLGRRWVLSLLCFLFPVVASVFTLGLGFGSCLE